MGDAEVGAGQGTMACLSLSPIAIPLPPLCSASAELRSNLPSPFTYRSTVFRIPFGIPPWHCIGDWDPSPHPRNPPAGGRIGSGGDGAWSPSGPPVTRGEGYPGVLPRHCCQDFNQDISQGEQPHCIAATGKNHLCPQESRPPYGFACSLALARATANVLLTAAAQTAGPGRGLFVSLPGAT